MGMLNVGSKKASATPGSEERFLPFSAPWFGPEEKSEILQVLDSDWITTGPRNRAFEEAFKEYTGSPEKPRASVPVRPGCNCRWPLSTLGQATQC